MRTPRVNPVGIVEVPDASMAAPRAYPARVRLAAAGVLACFLAATVGTTVYSLGAYCLTTYASVPFQFSP